MANTRKLSKFELANLVGPSKSGPSGTRLIGKFDLDSIKGRREDGAPVPEGDEVLDASGVDVRPPTIAGGATIPTGAGAAPSIPVDVGHPSVPPDARLTGRATDGASPPTTGDAADRVTVSGAVPIASPPSSQAITARPPSPSPPTDEPAASGERAAPSGLEADREKAASTPASEEPATSSTPTSTPIGDRLTPVEMPLPSRHDAMAISIPPPAVEVALDASSPTAGPPGAGRATAKSNTVEVAPSPTPEALRTKLAQRFTTIADKVNERFIDFHIGAGNWGLELSAPEGMSTADGKHALQHLRMRPRREGYPALLAGVVNALEHTAELRDYAHICAVHAARFGRPLEIAEAEWEQLLRRCEVTLKLAKIEAVRTPPPSDVLAAANPSHPWAWASDRRRLVPIVAAVALVVGLLLALAVRLLS